MHILAVAGIVGIKLPIQHNILYITRFMYLFHTKKERLFEASPLILLLLLGISIATNAHCMDVWSFMKAKSSYLPKLYNHTMYY